MKYDITKCELCPRKCGADRTETEGFCGGTAEIKVAKAYPHMWEEPCISGTKGSGTVFFSGCSLKCVFCQNYRISAENSGKHISVSRLGEIFLELQDKGVHNINLVSGGHYVPHIIDALDNVRGKLKIPVVYNSGGYELAETVRLLEGYVDIYLPDLKYYDNALAQRYSGADDYFETALSAIKEMYRQTGRYVIGDDGIMKKGVIIRHLTLPTHRHDSVRVLEAIRDNFGTENVLLSLMSQYTPFYRSSEFREISRRISTFEYSYVADKVSEMGFSGFMQERSSAKEEYTPDFDLTGI